MMKHKKINNKVTWNIEKLLFIEKDYKLHRKYCVFINKAAGKAMNTIIHYAFAS